ncbi:Zn-ribbon domain-containing OB-fold protein [Neptunicoccus cionae]|uniref:Zn-ribbon domain-containing OB-fold protein n=1 Tax=Neptunicoccus cionae TaxID=2035344 RepID=UPI000C77EF97|nr:zinc ribbon domain-containing protein [Amylibacter cionae]PLS23439.1 hypothetical protein C0U40_04785 [Amylibacter cionae]
MTNSTTALFQQEGTEALPSSPALIGGTCKSCGAIFFPMQNYGCEECGSTELAPKTLTGRGTLIASALVHMPVGTEYKEPFVVGSIQTEDGAILRSLLDAPADAALTPGMTMVAKLTLETRPNRGEYDLRFTPALD